MLLCERLIILLCLTISHLAFALPCAVGSEPAKSLNISLYTKKIGKITIIHLPRGEYHLSEPLKLPSNTIIQGEGKDTVLKLIVPFSGGKFITNEDHGRGNENITLKSLAIEVDVTTLKDVSPGIVRFENVNNLSLSALTVNVHSSLFAIDLASNCRNAIIDHCTVTNTGRGGCLMVRNMDRREDRPTHKVAVRNNFFRSQFVDEPVAVYGWRGNVHGVEIVRNTIVATGASYGISTFGIEEIGQTGTISDVLVSENDISGARTGGIGVKGGARNIQVVRNRIADTTGDGIFLHSGGVGLPKIEQVIVTENIITNVGRHGIFATGNNVLIDKNKISNCKQSGIYVGDAVHAIGNTITNALPGILVDGDKNIVVKNNVLIKTGIRILIENQSGIGENELLQ